MEKPLKDDGLTWAPIRLVEAERRAPRAGVRKAAVNDMDVGGKKTIRVAYLRPTPFHDGTNVM